MKYIILIAAFCLSGCMIEESEIKQAEKACKEYGGVDKIFVGLFSYETDALCKNGVKIKTQKIVIDEKSN